MKLSIVIMAHPDRREMAEELSVGLGGVPIVWDKINNLWDTCSRAWRSIDKSADYGLVLQDDIIACRDFISRAEGVLEGRFIYNFFIHRVLSSRVRMALSEKADRFFRASISSEVALCLPTNLIDEMLEYAREHNAKDDTVISRWATSKHLRVCYPIPSLVQHRDIESLFHKYTGRPVRSSGHITEFFADNL